MYHPKTRCHLKKSITDVKRQDLEQFVLLFTVFSCFVFNTIYHGAYICSREIEEEREYQKCAEGLI